MPLTVTVTKKQDGVIVVSPTGSIDSSTYRHLEDKMNSILDTSKKVIVLDMENVDYISSMGLSVIFKARKTVEESGGVFITVALQPQIKKVFEVVKALEGMNVFASVEEADEYLDRIQRGM